MCDGQRAAERFGENVRRLREAAGFSSEELAFRAGIHRTQISYIENGRRRVRFDTLVKLVGALGATPNDLFKGIAWRPAEEHPGAYVRPEDPSDDG